MALYRYEQKKYVKEQIEKVLDRENIEHIFLKGATLCNYYPEPWMRTSCDIDVLVKREDHQKVVNRLLINNFILILAVVANLIVLLLK